MQNESLRKQRKCKDITGQKFNKLTALKHTKILNHHSSWLWRCDCGNEKEIKMGSVVSGLTKSCGCLLASKMEIKICNFCNGSFSDYRIKSRVFCSSKCLGLSKLKKNGKERKISTLFEGQVCLGCKEFKSFSEFHRCSASSSGYNFRCKECVKKYQEWLKDNPADKRKQSRKKRELNPLRKCNKCELEKPISDFSAHSNKKHIQYTCKRCCVERSTKRYWEVDKPSGLAKTRNRKTTLKRYYNMTLQQYEEMFIAQKGVCLTCKLPEQQIGREYLSVDHCHKTNKIRGLLCGSCNRALGSVKDNIDVLQNMINYLRSHSDFIEYK